MLPRVIRLSSVVVMLALLAGCASTSIRESWTSPNARATSFDRMLVVYMDTNEGTRRAAEDQLVGRVGAGRAVASYTMFTAAEVQNAEQNEAAIKEKIDSAGIDGAVVMRPVGEDQKLSYSSGMTYPAYYGGFYGFYGYGWGMAYSPGYLRTDTIVSVETNLYDLRDEEDALVWAGITETLNPSDMSKMADDIADAISKELRSKGLVGR